MSLHVPSRSVTPVLSASRSRTIATSVSMLLLSSCDPTAPSGAGANSDTRTQTLAATGDSELVKRIKSIDITPLSTFLVTDLGGTSTRTFKVFARYNDRSVGEVSRLATFTVDKPAAGSFSGSQFTSDVRTAIGQEVIEVTARVVDAGTEFVAKTSLTVVWSNRSGADSEQLVVLPYESVVTSSVLFAATPAAADAFLAVDTTGSMSVPIANIRDAFDSTIVGGLTGAARSLWWGVGAIEDFPVDGYGSSTCSTMGDDQPLILVTPMTGNLLVARTGMDALLRAGAARGCGSDLPEGQMEALYQIATGEGNVVPGVVNIPQHRTRGRGGVEFREGAQPVVAMLTDAVFHTVGEMPPKCAAMDINYVGKAAMAAHTRTATTQALKQLCARAVGVSIEASGGPECSATGDLTNLATETGAMVPPEVFGTTTRPMGCAVGQCCTGINQAGEAPNAMGLCPLVFKTKSMATVSTASLYATALSHALRSVPVDVALEKSGSTTAEDGTALPAGKTTLSFVNKLEATRAIVSPGLPLPTTMGERFGRVIPGSLLSYTFTLKNDFVRHTGKPQVFRARFRAQSQGCANLEQRTLLLIVPAE